MTYPPDFYVHKHTQKGSFSKTKCWTCDRYGWGLQCQRYSVGERDHRVPGYYCSKACAQENLFPEFCKLKLQGKV